MLNISKNKYLVIIILIGLILRLAFIIFGAELYFGRSNIFVDGDTFMWQKSIENLIENGTYTVIGDQGRFSRMPGYSFFIGVFYLLFGGNWDLAFTAIGWSQSFIDVYCIYLIYKITKRLFKNNQISLISAFIYATYPFIIVWCPVVYSEQLGITLLLIGFLKYLDSNNSKKTFVFSGFMIGLAALTRPQIIPFGLVICISTLFEKKELTINKFKKALIFGFSFLFTFGLWPARNYLFHNEIIITKNAEGFANWQEDVLAFMQYTYAVKTEWNPQYTSIIKNKKTTYPTISYKDKSDSILLENTIYLCKNCGSGFSFKKGYWKKPFYEPNCNRKIVENFDYLRVKQIKDNPFNFYFILPIKNLGKAIFKKKLYDESNIYRKFGSLLFYLRTTLILLGLLGVLLLIKSKIYDKALIFILFFIAIYFVLSFGTSPFMRNIEVRYFLPADILLLFPASLFIHKILNKII